MPPDISRDVMDLLLKLLQKDPKVRLGGKGAHEIKAHPFFKVLKWEEIRIICFQPFVLSCGSSNHWRFELPVFWLTLRSTFCLQTVDWDLLSQKKIAAPFKPRIGDELDVSNFAEEFTDMVPTYSPAAVPKTADRIFKVQWTELLKSQTLCETINGANSSDIFRLKLNISKLYQQ